MKFSPLKTILSLLIIGMVFSTNTMRSKAKDAGNGTWDAGYLCPNVFISEGKGAAKDQGAAKIMAPQIVDPKDDNNKLGLNFIFTNAPAADSFIVKIGTKVNDKTYYIPYRFFQSDMAFNNPVRESKTLISSFVADNKNRYTIKINLPYKTFGWYIDDTESNKMRTIVNESAILARGNVSLNKSVISTNAQIYLQKKALLDAATKDKASLDAKIAAQKADAKRIQTELETLKAQIKDAKQSVFAKQKEVQAATAALNAANAKVTSMSTQMNNIELSVQGLATPNDQKLKTTQKKLADLTAQNDAQYAALKVEISSKVAEFNKSKEGLEAMDKAKFEAGLTSSYPQ